MTKRKAIFKYDWLTSISFLWIWIVAKQWISFTEEIWFEETTSLVSRTIVIIIVIEVLLPLKRGYRLIIECALILLTLWSTMLDYKVYNPTEELQSGMDNFISAMQPYVWFAFSAAILCLFIAKFIRSQRWILLFMGLNVIAMAILDSFTETILWDKAAWMVFAMMGWLVSHHFQRFKSRYPVGWRNLLRSPFEMIAHIVLIFAVIFLLGVNMPKVSPILTDPYTAWTERNSDSTDVNSKKVEVKTANAQPSTSGYSMEDNQLGAGFDFDYSLVMTVKSSQRNYWRGETRSVYSGTGWKNETRKESSLDDVTAEEELERESSSAIIQTEKVQQHITIADGKEYPVLFGAFAMSSLQTLNSEKDMKGIQWNAPQAELHWNAEQKNAKYPQNYVVTSEIPIIPVEELRMKSFDDLYDNFSEKDYLQIPKGFPKRVGELAAKITESAETPYEKIALLQTYLGGTFEYTNTPEVSRKISDDFVDSFLFEIREGYCDYFSTSMVMLARSLDIPARWVKGYAPGRQPQMDDLRMMQQGQSDSGTYIVTNADAHSWVEVYFGPYGWIPVEATPGFDMPLLEEMDNSVDTQEVDPQEKEETEDKTPVQSTDKGIPSIWIKGISVASILLILSWLGYLGWKSRHSIYFLWLRLRMGKELSPAEKVVAETERWLRSVHRHGLTRGKNETLRESVAKWHSSVPALGESLDVLLELFEKARYSPEAIASDEWRAVQKVAEQLKVALRAKNNT